MQALQEVSQAKQDPSLRYLPTSQPDTQVSSFKVYPSAHLLH